MPTNINYVGIWGMDVENAPKVFDSVQKVSEFIYRKLITEAEAIRNNGELREASMYTGKIPSAEEIADLVGCGKYYREGEEKLEKEFNEVKETFYRLYNRL